MLFSKVGSGESFGTSESPGAEEEEEWEDMGEWATPPPPAPPALSAYNQAYGMNGLWTGAGCPQHSEECRPRPVKQHTSLPRQFLFCCIANQEWRLGVNTAENIF